MAETKQLLRFLMDIAHELKPVAETVERPSRKEIMNKLTLLASILSAMALTKE